MENIQEKFDEILTNSHLILYEIKNKKRHFIALIKSRKNVNNYYLNAVENDTLYMDHSFNWEKIKDQYVYIDDIDYQAIVNENSNNLTQTKIAKLININSGTFRSKLSRNSLNAIDWIKLKNLLKL
ncbi:MAG: hypothetical protein U9N10_08920 [Bacillota bacterium]|nr:hypothetical protein [Bacillota bacterium]